MVRRGIEDYLYAKLEKEFDTFKRQVEVGEGGRGGLPNYSVIFNA